jgi:hypothetical protein
MHMTDWAFVWPVFVQLCQLIGPQNDADGFCNNICCVVLCGAVWCMRGVCVFTLFPLTRFLLACLFGSFLQVPISENRAINRFCLIRNFATSPAFDFMARE